MSKTLSKILEIRPAILSGCPPLSETLEAIPQAIDSDLKTVVQGFDEFKKYREAQCKRLGHSPYAATIELNAKGFVRFSDSAPKVLNGICDIAFEVDRFTKLVQGDREAAIEQKDSLDRVNKRLHALVKTLEDEIAKLHLLANTNQPDIYLIHARRLLNDNKPDLKEVENELAKLKASNPPQDRIDLMLPIREACYLKNAAVFLTEACEKLPLTRTANPLPHLTESLSLLQQSQSF